VRNWRRVDEHGIFAFSDWLGGSRLWASRVIGLSSEGYPPRSANAQALQIHIARRRQTDEHLVGPDWASDFLNRCILTARDLLHDPVNRAILTKFAEKLFEDWEISRQTMDELIQKAPQAPDWPHHRHDRGKAYRGSPLGRMLMVSGRGNRQHLADRLDPMSPSVIVDERDHGQARLATGIDLGLLDPLIQRLRG
jgi:hypothetical protein